MTSGTIILTSRDTNDRLSNLGRLDFKDKTPGNGSDEPQTFTLGYGGELAEASLPARSIATYVLGN